MSFAELYVLASKVRSKLTRQAANPKASLRSLVVQANMLDNLMDHIESEKQKAAQQPRRVSFSLPQKPQSPNAGPSVNEYEIDYDSASDDEDDYYNIDRSTESTVYSLSDLDSDSDSDDFYYLSDEEDEPSALYRHLPTIDLSDMHLHRSLLVIKEEAEELPELARSSLQSDSDSEIEDVAHAVGVSVADPEHIQSTPKAPSKAPELTAAVPVTHAPIARHLRHNAVYLMEHVF